MGRPAPASAIEPELAPGDVLYLRAFLDLQHDKTQLRSIPWSSVDRFAERYGITGGQFEKLKSVVFEANAAIEAALAERQSQLES